MTKQEQIKEALETVQDLNTVVFEKDNEEYLYFSISSNGDAICIDFLSDVQIWRSDEDGRDFDEVKNEYEPLLGFCKKIFNKYVDDLVKNKFELNQTSQSDAG